MTTFNKYMQTPSILLNALRTDFHPDGLRTDELAGMLGFVAVTVPPEVMHAAIQDVKDHRAAAAAAAARLKESGQ